MNRFSIFCSCPVSLLLRSLALRRSLPTCSPFPKDVILPGKPTCCLNFPFQSLQQKLLKQISHGIQEAQRSVQRGFFFRRSTNLAVFQIGGNYLASKSPFVASRNTSGCSLSAENKKHIFMSCKSRSTVLELK